MVSPALTTPDGTGSPVVGAAWVIGEDPLHQDCSAPVTWTTVNLAEAFPGVPTPLTWSVVGPVFEAMARGGWVVIGVMPRSYASVPPDVEHRLMTIFHGRPAFSLDAWRLFGDSMPGTSADAVETQIFGARSSGAGTSSATSSANWRRYPVVAAKMPVAVRRSRRAMGELATTTDQWWRTAVSGHRPGSRDELLALLRDAQGRILTIGTHHTVLSMLAFAAYEQLRALAVYAGLPGLETELLGGDADSPEARTVADLWELSRDRLSHAAFLDRHGFHGPAEGELATPSWRQRDAPLEALLATYRKLTDDDSPAAGLAHRVAVREAAQRRLLAALNPARRAQARLLFGMAHRYMPLRELGRCTFLKAIDVARYAASAIGSELARDGLIEAPEDVFQLCLHELELPTSPPGSPPSRIELVARRRARHAAYGGLELPDVFTGAPTPVPVAGPGDDPSVTGLGVSSGIVEGRARVIVELGDDDVEAGEILVCRTTDPGWASYFFVAGGVVIDVGGPISHGAIVARELGIPCVINTRTGTQRLHTGDLIRVDGTTGTVTLLEKENAR